MKTEAETITDLRKKLRKAQADLKAEVAAREEVERAIAKQNIAVKMLSDALQAQAQGHGIRAASRIEPEQAESFNGWVERQVKVMGRAP